MKRIILINIFTICVIIFCLEFIVGALKLSNLMGIDNKLILLKNNEDYKFRPNSSGKVFDKIVFTDKNGFRVPNKNFEYTKNKSIVFFGDSVTFGNGVREQNTFIGYLRNKYNNYNIYNISLPGYQATHHKSNLKYINEFKNVKKVYYIFTLNVIKELSNLKLLKIKKDDNNANLNYVEELKEIKLFRYVNSYLRNKSYLYLFLKGKSTDPSQRWFKIDKNHYEKKNLDSFEEILIKFKEVTFEKDIDFKVILLPYEFQTRKNNCNKNNLNPQIKIQSLLKKNKIDHKDFSKNFCYSKNAKNLFYKFDPMHLSKKGHKFLFNLIINDI